MLSNTVLEENACLEIELKGYVLPEQERFRRMYTCSVSKYVVQFHANRRLPLADRLSFV